MVNYMKLRLVDHLNYIDQKGKVFCKKKDRVVTLDESQASDCEKCQYVFGFLQGDGIECQCQMNSNLAICTLKILTKNAKEF